MGPVVGELNRKALGLFGLAAAGSTVWFALSLLAPDAAVGPVPLRLVLTLAVSGIFLYGLWRGLSRANFPQSQRVAGWVGAALVLTAWMAAAWALAANGFFRRGLGPVPTLPIAIVLPLLIGVVALTRSRAVGTLLDATPASWLVGLQVYRVLGSMFLAYWMLGRMPGAFALPAGIGDVATGLLALPAAVWVASGSPIGRRIGVRWNAFGMTDFAVAIAMGMLTAPGPTQLLARDHPNVQIGMFPTAMVPAFIVPFSTLLHVLSLRQLKRLNAKTAIARQEPVLVNA